MAYTGGYFESWMVEAQRIALGLAPAPDPSKTELLLFVPSGPIDGTASLSDITDGELATINGYSRYTLDYIPDDVVWDSASHAAVVAQSEWTVEATGGPLQWQGIAMVVDGGEATERLVAGYVNDVLLTIPDGTDHTFLWQLTQFNTLLEAGNPW